MSAACRTSSAPSKSCPPAARTGELASRLTNDSEQLRQVMATETDRWRKLIKDTGMKLD